MALSKRTKKFIFGYALGYGLLHHLFHLWIQPILSRHPFFQNLPPLFLGSTFGVTIFVATMTFIGTWYLLRN